MDETIQTVSVGTWITGALTGPDRGFQGIEFYELSDAPVSMVGLALLEASCALLDTVRAAVRGCGAESGTLIPYIKFRLADSEKLLEWTAEIWGAIRGDRACLELTFDGRVFYWGVWESHHQTLSLPTDAGSRYVAIFRRHKGFYDGEPWEQYDNEIFVFARPT